MAFGFLKKNYKKDPLKDAIYPVPPFLTGGIFIFGRIGCLDKDTEIIVSDKGIQKNEKIKDLPEYFDVLSFNEEKDLNEVKRAHKVDSGKQKCYKITFEDGTSVIATRNHTFFTPAMEEIIVKDLKLNDRLFKKL